MYSGTTSRPVSSRTSRTTVVHETAGGEPLACRPAHPAGRAVCGPLRAPRANASEARCTRSPQRQQKLQERLVPPVAGVAAPDPEPVDRTERFAAPCGRAWGGYRMSIRRMAAAGTVVGLVAF